MIEIEGKTVVLTGTFHEMKRSEAARAVEAMGAKVSGSVSAKTDMLFAGEKAGSKLAKAKQLGVDIYDEGQLMELLAARSVDPMAMKEAPDPAPVEVVPSAFTGKKIVLTGTFASMKRSAAKKVLTEAGAVVSGSVSKNTDLLIHGADAGSKLAKAQSLGVAVMTESEMIALLSKAGAGADELAGADEKLAAKQAKDRAKYAKVYSLIAKVHEAQVTRHGLTLGQLLRAYLRVFAQRPDVYVRHHEEGAPAKSIVLNRLRRSVPIQLVALSSEMDTLHFAWIFEDKKAEMNASIIGYNGGLINLCGLTKLAWWKRPDDWDFVTFEEQAMVDELQNEGSTMLSYEPGEQSTEALFVFDDANEGERFPMGTTEEYFTLGARRGFVWYWQRSQYWEAKDFTKKLFDASLPLDTPEDQVVAALIGKGLSEVEAKAMVSWLDDDAVILLPK